MPHQSIIFKRCLGFECIIHIKLTSPLVLILTDAFNNEHCRLHWNYAKGGPIFLADPLEISEFTLKKLSFKKEIDDLSAAGKPIHT